MLSINMVFIVNLDIILCCGSDNIYLRLLYIILHTMIRGYDVILGCRFKRQYLVLCYICFFSFLVLISHVAFYIISIIEGDQWNAVNSKWAKLIGFIR